MNVDALQRADRLIGVPLCWALTLVRRLLPARRPSARPRSILIVKLAEQGSTVLAYAALRRAVQLVGRENVHFLAFQPNRFILDALEVIPRENVVTIAVDGVGSFVASTLRALQVLRRRKFDAAVDLEFFSRGSAVLAYLSGAKARVGFHGFGASGPYRGDLMTHRLLYNPHLHTSETFLSLIEAVVREGAEFPAYDFVARVASDDVPRFRPDTEEAAVVARLVFGEAGERVPVILLNPNASDLVPLRKWPRERYRDLAIRLLQRYPEAIVALTGGPTEAAAAAELVREVGSSRCVSLAGRTTLRQLLVLYTLSDVLVTNDSGPAHFATLTPINVVTLFGPETPRLFAARSPRNTVLWAGLACSPCVSAFNNRVSPCRDNRCMQAITVDQVFAAVCTAYDKRRAERRTVEAVSELRAALKSPTCAPALVA